MNNDYLEGMTTVQQRNVTSIYEPQNPLYHKEKDAYFYPLTSEKQIVMDDGRRLNAVLEEDFAKKDEVNSAKAEAVNDSKVYINEQIKKAAPRNLLDNSDFEIAQAGYGELHEANKAPYAADRWQQNDTTKRSYSKETHNEHGALKCTTETRIQQNIHLIEGAVYTASVIVGNTKLIKSFVANKGSNGASNLWVNYQSAGYYQFVISSVPANAIISEPVLYRGEYTLDTLPEYQPKGYAAELLECQRYFYSTRGKYYFCGYGSAISATEFYATLQVPVQMRVKPTVVNSGGFVARGGGTEHILTFSNVEQTVANGINIRFSGTELVAYEAYVLRTTGIIMLSADL